MHGLRIGWRPPAGAVPLFDEPFEPASVSAVREAVLRTAAVQGLADFTLTKFVTAVYGVTVDTVIYGGGGGQVQIWRTPGDLWCRIIDHGPGTGTGIAAGSGWGTSMWLTAQLCTEVHVGDNDHDAFVVLRFPCS
jgi:serine/threonine-protein kinase RsbW